MPKMPAPGMKRTSRRASVILKKQKVELVCYAFVNPKTNNVAGACTTRPLKTKKAAETAAKRAAKAAQTQAKEVTSTPARSWGEEYYAAVDKDRQQRKYDDYASLYSGGGIDGIRRRKRKSTRKSTKRRTTRR